MTRGILTLMLASLLAGCASFQLPGTTPDIETLDRWLDKHQYGRVMKAIDDIPSNHPNYAHYAARRTAAAQLASQYETSVLAGIADDEKEQDWASAIVQVDEALLNYPESQRLQAKRSELFAKQQHRTRKLNAETLLVRTRWLENELPLIKKRAENAPVDISLHWQVSQLEKEFESSVDNLIMSATELFEYDELDLIQRCLNRANELGTNKNEENTIALLQERLNTRRAEIRKHRHAIQLKRERKLKSSRQSERQQHIKKLLADAYADMENNDLFSAKENATELKRLSPHDSEVNLLQEKVLGRIKTEVDRLTTRGNSLYRQEKIAEAKSVWEKALRLDPDNRGLKTNIERATRVLSKLQKLRNEQQAN